MKAQLRILKRLNAPQELVDDFIEVCQINNRLPADMQVSVKELLEEKCREHGFDEILDDGWFFRPYALGGSFRHFDTASQANEPYAAVVEQAYRRGYDQGFANCRAMVAGKRNLHQIKKRETNIHAWRIRTVQKFRSTPGDPEKPGRNIFGGRSSLSAKLRYQILYRDKFRCVACGATAKDGTKLEVDHIVPVSKGGSDDVSNLQTLCQRCNSGKSNHMFD